MDKSNPGHKTNPRYKNGNLRRKYRDRLKAQGGPCGICHGRLGEIRYDEPSDWKHPLSFVIDEIIPVSRWKEYGYNSPEEAAQDWNNLQAAHWCCNQAKSNRVLSNNEIKIKKQGAVAGFIDNNQSFNNEKTINNSKLNKIISKINLPDGSW